MEVRVQHQDPAALLLVPIQWEAGWIPEAIWTIWGTEGYLVFSEIRTANRPAGTLVVVQVHAEFWNNILPPSSRRLP